MMFAEMLYNTTVNQVTVTFYAINLVQIEAVQIDKEPDIIIST